jgi:hypothetical protein
MQVPSAIGPKVAVVEALLRIPAPPQTPAAQPETVRHMLFPTVPPSVLIWDGLICVVGAGSGPVFTASIKTGVALTGTNQVSAGCGWPPVNTHETV